MVLPCDSVLLLVLSHMVNDTTLCTWCIPPLVFDHSLDVDTHNTPWLVQSTRSVVPFSQSLYKGTRWEFLQWSTSSSVLSLASGWIEEFLYLFHVAWAITNKPQSLCCWMWTVLTLIAFLSENIMSAMTFKVVLAPKCMLSYTLITLGGQPMVDSVTQWFDDI